jgi:hypothetical protein
MRQAAATARTVSRLVALIPVETAALRRAQAFDGGAFHRESII